MIARGATLRILDATNDVTFNVDLAAAYRATGAEVQLGTEQLLVGERRFDIVHCHWPEELVGWQNPPPADAVDRVLHALDAAARSAFLICTVHNLLPHAAREDDGASREFYAAFFARMDAIGHFSQTSVERVRQAYPEIDPARHFVHGMNLFASLRQHTMTRTEARALLGIADDRPWVATFGHMRHSAELTLVHRAVALAGRDAPGLLLAGRLPRSHAKRRHVLNRIDHALWLRRHGVTPLTGYLSDRVTAALFQAMDAVIITRSGRHLNSGLLPLATTFGTPLIAPDYGIYREFLTQSGNLMYQPGDAQSLAQALRDVPSVDQSAVIAANLARSRQWGCDGIVAAVLDRFAAWPGR